MSMIKKKYYEISAIGDGSSDNPFMPAIAGNYICKYDSTLNKFLVCFFESNNFYAQLPAECIEKTALEAQTWGSSLDSTFDINNIGLCFDKEEKKNMKTVDLSYAQLLQNRRKLHLPLFYVQGDNQYEVFYTKEGIGLFRTILNSGTIENPDPNYVNFETNIKSKCNIDPLPQTQITLKTHDFTDSAKWNTTDNSLYTVVPKTGEIYSIREARIATSINLNLSAVNKIHIRIIQSLDGVNPCVTQIVNTITPFTDWNPGFIESESRGCNFVYLDCASNTKMIDTVYSCLDFIQLEASFLKVHEPTVSRTNKEIIFYFKLAEWIEQGEIYLRDSLKERIEIFIDNNVAYTADLAYASFIGISEEDY